MKHNAFCHCADCDRKRQPSAIPTEFHSCGCVLGQCWAALAVMQGKETTAFLETHRRIGAIKAKREAETDFSVALRYATLQIPPRWQYAIGVDMGYESPPSPPKCPPSCTPAAPCGGTICTAKLKREAEVAKWTANVDAARKPTQPRPSPETRRIGADGLMFGRWNGRAPR
jgi:hypothetical protein